jgi:hypothetical protein
MTLNTGQWVVIIVCSILILGYILGYYYNRERARQIFTWLRQGLSSLGEVTVGEKLPGMATGGRLEVNQAAAPLKRVEAVYLLAPRENLLFWIFHILQGRGDELVVWINYQSKPEQCIEVARRGDRQFEKRLKDKDKPALSVVNGKRGLQVAVEDKPGSLLAGKVQSFISNHPSTVIRMALRPEKPHLFLRANLSRIQKGTAVDFFATLSELVVES